MRSYHLLFLVGFFTLVQPISAVAQERVPSNLEFGLSTDLGMLLGRHWDAEVGLGGMFVFGFRAGRSIVFEIGAGPGYYASQYFSLDIPGSPNEVFWDGFWVPRINMEVLFRTRAEIKSVRPFLGLGGSWTTIHGNDAFGFGGRAGLRWKVGHGTALDFGFTADLVHLRDPNLFFVPPGGSRIGMFTRIMTSRIL